MTGPMPPTSGVSEVLTCQLPAGGEVVGGSAGDDLGSAEARAVGGPELAPLPSHGSPHPPNTDPGPVCEADEQAAAAVRDLAATISIRLHELEANAVTPAHLAVVAMGAATPPALPLAVPVLHLRNAAATARTLADVFDMWASKMEAR